MSDEPKISERYRELPREEPPRALDDAILAASRRAVESRPAPLVVPTGRRRWYFPVAAAAVIVLAVAVVAHVEREKPDEEILASSAPAPQGQPSAVEDQKTEAPKAAAEAPKRAAKPSRPQFAPDPRADSPASAAPPALQAENRGREDAVGAVSGGVRGLDAAPSTQASPPLAPAPAPMAKPAPNPPDAGAVAASRLSAAYAETPERKLERIAELRQLGRHEEADKALAEFRKAYPDYKIPGAMLERLERR